MRTFCRPDEKAVGLGVNRGVRLEGPKARPRSGCGRSFRWFGRSGDTGFGGAVAEQGGPGRGNRVKFQSRDFGSIWPPSVVRVATLRPVGAKISYRPGFTHS